MSRLIHRTPGGRLRASAGRYTQAVPGGAMLGPRGAFRDRRQTQAAEPEPEMEEKDDDAQK